jgi:hypothetical protein
MSASGRAEERIQTHFLSAESAIERVAMVQHRKWDTATAVSRALWSAESFQRFELEVVHLGQEKGCASEAGRIGVKSVPALVLDDQAYNINFGARLDALK